jgi:transposase
VSISCEAARIGGLDRQTLRDWVHRFNGSGLEASSTTGRTVPSLVFRRSNWLSSRRSSRPARIVRRTGSSCWRRLDLKRVIAERFGVAFHERYVGKLLKKLGFSPMSARPRHAQNERVVEAFKTYGPPRLQEIIRERR